MYLNAKADYAVRAVLELADSSQAFPRTLEEIATAQAIPASFLPAVLMQLRNAGLIRSQRGSNGGYWLARPAEELDLGTVIRAVAGPLIAVRGQAPEEIVYAGSAASLRQVWLALDASMHHVLERVTVADVAAGELPRDALTFANEP